MKKQSKEKKKVRIIAYWKKKIVKVKKNQKEQKGTLTDIS